MKPRITRLHYLALRVTVIAVLMIGLATAAALWVLAGVASASVGGWSTPTKLSTSDMKWAWFPSVAADDSGNIHVVFSNGNVGLSSGRFDISQLWYTESDAG